MKKIKNQKTTTKVAIFAGAAALMALTPQTHAQSSVDALLNKLEQKGILSVDKAKELKAENATNTVSDFNKEFNSKIQMPDWVTSYKLSGDFRGRFDDVSTGSPVFGAAPAQEKNNMRLRYRLRVGLTANLKDDLQVGFRLGTDDTGKGADATTAIRFQTIPRFKATARRNPSGLMRLTANGRRSTTAPGWWPEPSARWTCHSKRRQWCSTPITRRKARRCKPLTRSTTKTRWRSTAPRLCWISPPAAGRSFTARRPSGTRIGRRNSARPWALPRYDIADDKNLAAAATGMPYDSNLGNTITGSAPATPFVANFNPIVASGSITYTLDSFPLYPGAFPIKLAGEYLDNPAAASNNTGWWGGVTLGKSGKKACMGYFLSLSAIGG